MSMMTHEEFLRACDLLHADFMALKREADELESRVESMKRQPENNPA